MKLSEIIQRDPGLKQHFQAAQKNYTDSYQRALYTSPNDNERHYLRDGGYDTDRDPVLLIIGMLQDNRADKH